MGKIIHQFISYEYSVDYDLKEDKITSASLYTDADKYHHNKMAVIDCERVDLDEVERRSLSHRYWLGRKQTSAPDARLKVFVSPLCEISRDLIRQTYDIVRSPDKADILVAPYWRMSCKSYDGKIVKLELKNPDGSLHSTHLVRIYISWYYKGYYNYSASAKVSEEKHKEILDTIAETLKKRFENSFKDCTVDAEVLGLDATYAVFKDDYCLAQMLDGDEPDTAPQQLVIADCHLKLQYPNNMTAENLYALSQCKDEQIVLKTLENLDYQHYPFTYYMLVEHILDNVLPYRLPPKVDVLRNWCKVMLDSGNAIITPKDFELFQDLVFKLFGVEEQGLVDYKKFGRMVTPITNLMVKKVAIRKAKIDRPISYEELKEQFWQ